jgi:hypothetical protein
MSSPLTSTLPALGRRMLEIMLRVVVFPLPEGPTMNSISPKWATSSISFTATFFVSPSPNHLVRPVATIASLPPGFSPWALIGNIRFRVRTWGPADRHALQGCGHSQISSQSWLETSFLGFQALFTPYS